VGGGGGGDTTSADGRGPWGGGAASSGLGGGLSGWRPGSVEPATPASGFPPTGAGIAVATGTATEAGRVDDFAACVPSGSGRTPWGRPPLAPRSPLPLRAGALASSAATPGAESSGSSGDPASPVRAPSGADGVRTRLALAAARRGADAAPAQSTGSATTRRVAAPPLSPPPAFSSRPLIDSRDLAPPPTPPRAYGWARPAPFGGGGGFESATAGAGGGWGSTPRDDDCVGVVRPIGGRTAHCAAARRDSHAPPPPRVRGPRSPPLKGGTRGDDHDSNDLLDASLEREASSWENDAVVIADRPWGPRQGPGGARTLATARGSAPARLRRGPSGPAALVLGAARLPVRAVAFAARVVTLPVRAPLALAARLTVGGGAKGRGEGYRGKGGDSGKGGDRESHSATAVLALAALAAAAGAAGASSGAGVGGGGEGGRGLPPRLAAAARRAASRAGVGRGTTATTGSLRPHPVATASASSANLDAASAVAQPPAPTALWDDALSRPSARAVASLDPAAPSLRPSIRAGGSSGASGLGAPIDVDGPFAPRRRPADLGREAGDATQPGFSLEHSRDLPARLGGGRGRALDEEGARFLGGGAGVWGAGSGRSRGGRATKARANGDGALSSGPAWREGSADADRDAFLGAGSRRARETRGARLVA